MSRVAAILLAAGRGARMQDSVSDKILASLAGRPVFAYSAAAFQTSGVADFYAIVYRDTLQLHALMAYAPTPATFVHGGQERQDSVARALDALPADIDYVFIHDCARPLVRAEQLIALHKIVRRENAVVLAHRVTDTIKEHLAPSPAKGRTAVRLRTLDGSRLRTFDRSRLWAMETPQVFSRKLITRAYARVAAKKLRITDDAQAVELLGQPVALLENPHPNPKLTTSADLDLLEFLIGHNKVQA